MSVKSIAEREADGRDARREVPRSSHAEWMPAQHRIDPISLLQAQNETRVPWLVPVRHARMSASPLTFYRGTAGIMAADLSTTPTSGFEVQLIGDGHLSNFGAYASPERQLVFDANDFDETLRGPWEWDVKRLAASCLVAARQRDFDHHTCRTITRGMVEAYREAMHIFGKMRFMQLWYEHTTVRDIHNWGSKDPKDLDRRLAEFERRARSKNSLQALKKLTVEVDGRFRIRTDRPVLVPIREVHPDRTPDEIESAVRGAFADYISTLRDDRRRLLERYELVDIALKVVGVGSVGTRCYVLLLEGRDERDPLFLQAKEANASVLERHLHTSQYGHHGQRVVQGQRQIQAQSDICLGWATSTVGVEFYWRQLRDWKRSFDIETATPDELAFYVRLCGRVLARGHARSGDAVAISSYMGKSEKFDRAIVEFSERYANQTVADFQTFRAAIAAGTLASDDGY